MTEKFRNDTGILFALVCLVLAYRFDERFLLLSAAFLLVVLFMPQALAPLAQLWLALSKVLGAVMNRIFFGIVYFVVITPIGLLRRALDTDMLAMRYGRGDKTAFTDRAHLYVKDDIQAPY